jgi:iron complex transport system ATP-binding protein
VSVLHDLSIALLADRIVILEGGRIRVEGPSHAPSIHSELELAFGAAIRVERVGTGFVAVPRLEIS